MCGLFGFFGNQVNLSILLKAAQEAARRGPHAYGFVWEGGAVYGQGCLSEQLDKLAEFDGKWLIGNARLATFGDYHDERNRQPLCRDGVVLSHNGNLYTARNLYQSLGYTPATDVDSEALLAACLLRPDWRALVYELAGSVAQAALLLLGGRLYTIRLGHPLYQLQTETGIYLSSRPFGPHCALAPEGIFELSL